MISIIPDIFTRFSRQYDFPKDDIEQIKESIKPYLYSKNDLMDNPERFSFRVEDKGDKFILHNFHNDSKSDLGICEELAHKTSKKLNKMFEGKYIFFPVESCLSDYNLYHNSLRGLPVEKIELLKELLKITKEKLNIQELLKTWNGTIHEPAFLDRLDTIYDFYIKALNSSLYIDSAFKVVKPAKKKDNKFLTGLLPRKISNPYLPKNVSPYLHSSLDIFEGISLGFAKQYLPEVKGISDTSVLLLSILKDNNVPHIVYYIRDIGKKDFFLDKRLLRPDNLTIKFAEFIKKSLKLFS